MATVRVESRRFGVLELPESAIIDFPEGLIGFPGQRRYAILEHPRPGVPLKWMLCVDDPELAFAIADPDDFSVGYTIRVDGEIEALEVRDLGELAVFVIVTIPAARPRDITANLLAPVLVNTRTRRGRQVVLADSVYSTRHRPLRRRP